jgi:hypothetical protein
VRQNGVKEKHTLFWFSEFDELTHSPFSTTELKECTTNLIIAEEMCEESSNVSLLM